MPTRSASVRARPKVKLPRPAHLKTRIGAGVELLKEVARKADSNFDGKLSKSEVARVTGSVQDGNVVQAAFWGVFGKAKAASKKSTPALDDFNKAAAAVKAELKGSGPSGTTSTAVASFSVQYSSKRDPSINFLFDHDGDLPVSQRDSVQLQGTPREQAENLVWYFNQRANDNRWPKWAGRIISRNVLGLAEAKAVTQKLSSLPPAKAKALLRALSDWIVKGGPGCLYLLPEAVKPFDDLAKKLKVTASFVGPKATPRLST